MPNRCRVTHKDCISLEMSSPRGSSRGERLFILVSLVAIAHKASRAVRYRVGLALFDSLVRALLGSSDRQVVHVLVSVVLRLFLKRRAFVRIDLIGLLNWHCNY